MNRKKAKDALFASNYADNKSKSKLEQVHSFRTTDGKLFSDKKEAESYQSKLNFIDWYEENRILGNHLGSYVDCPEIMGWLKDNKTIVLDFLGHVE